MSKENLPESLRRRKLIKIAGAGGAVGLSGCVGGGDEAGTGDGGGDGGDGGGTDGNQTEDGGGDQEQQTVSYEWSDATWDSYWFSLYNMSTNIAMSGNGVLFPHNEQQRQMFNNRLQGMLEVSGEDGPPVANPNLNMAPFTRGHPGFAQEPVLEDDSGRPDASTLWWDGSESSQVVSPSSLAWTHLKGVTWAKNFQSHFDLLPDSLAAEFRSMMLTTLGQIGINASLLSGGPQSNGALTRGGDDSFRLVSQFRPPAGVYTEEQGQVFELPESPGYPDRTTRPHHHAAMLWFLSDMNSLAQNGWYGYENPQPLLPREAGADAALSGMLPEGVGIQEITDGMAQTTMDFFSPSDVASQQTTRTVGLMLGAVGFYEPQASSDELSSMAAEYANGLAGVIEDNLAGNGMVENGAENQAATQGIVGQGLLWASEMDGVDHTGTAEEVLGYMMDTLYDEDAGTFASGEGDTTYTITARDAGDVTGGMNAADEVLGMEGAKETYATYFNNTFRRGSLQRAERPNSRSEDDEYTLPLPPEAGGEFGQAAVYNSEVEYDTEADEWSVTDDAFRTEWALYLANQEIWISQWGNEFYEGRGVPGTNQQPPSA
jgi:hypothetical protein